MFRTFSYSRTLNVEQALELLFEDDSDNEFTDIVLHPPADGNCSDKESGDEEAVNPDHLTRRQLIAEAEIHGEHESSVIEAETTDKPTTSWKK